MTDLPTNRPLTADDLAQSYAGYRKGLATLTIPELMELSTRQAQAIAESQASMLSRLLPASSPTSDLDEPVIRSMPTATPSSGREPDRGRPASPSPRQSSLELLGLKRGGRMGPRLGAKLLIADARAQARRREEYR